MYLRSTLNMKLIKVRSKYIPDVPPLFPGVPSSCRRQTSGNVSREMFLEVWMKDVSLRRLDSSLGRMPKRKN